MVFQTGGCKFANGMYSTVWRSLPWPLLENPISTIEKYEEENGLSMKIDPAMIAALDEFNNADKWPVSSLEHVRSLVERDPSVLGRKNEFGWYPLRRAVANVNRLTEDDIAALYFLYPIKNRQKKWSRHVPYKYMRKSKLHWIARKLRVKIEESAARPQIANTICKSLAQQGVDRLSHLGSAKLSSMVFDWGWVRQQSATEKEAAANHSARIQMLKAKTQALLSSHSEKDTTKQKDALDEYYLAKNNVDEENERMPNIVGRVGDLNNDGVDDRDDDGDGLPNEIEAGLEALHEMLEDNALTEVLAELQETDETRKLSNDEEL